MPRSRSIDDPDAQSGPSGSIAWIDEEPTPDGDAHNTNGPRHRVVSVIGSILVVGLATVLFVGAIDRVDESIDQETSSPEPASSPALRQSTTSPTTPTPSPVSAEQFLDQLPTTPEEWLAGQVLVWVDENENLRARRLDNGVDLPVSVLAQTNLPPLPDHVHLVGAENATWLFDLEEPERSGKLSNSVRMVRLGTGLDSYGFSSTNDAGATEFFVGSLWGPAMNGLAEVDSTTTVLSVPGTGIISSGRDATSAVLRGSGFEALPSRLGRIVAASASRVLGIHCDDLGRCVGRIAAWDGSDEQQIDASLLTSPVVRISPDSRFIVAGGGSALHVIDLESGSQESWPLEISPDASLTWASDSRTVFFLVEGSLVAVRVGEPVLSVSRVRSAGPVGEMLAGADVLIIAEDPSG